MQKTLFTGVGVLLTLLLFIAPVSTPADTITGGATSVALDSTTVGALTGLGFTLAPLGSATLDASTLTIVFPVTGGSIGSSGDIINHNGSGLSLTEGGTTLDLTNFVIDTSTLLLTGKATVGSTVIPSLNLFDIGAGDKLTLDPAAGAALSGIFGVPNLSGASIGTATVSPTVASPEPSSLALLGVALAIGAAFSLKKMAL
jgi:hypothetical protein